MGRTVDHRVAYSLLPSQKRFHDSKARFKGFSGPIGSGKTQALCQEAVRLSFVNAGRMGLIGAPTYPMLRDVAQPAFLRILRENGVPHEFNKSEQVVTLTELQSKVLFRPVEEFDRLRGTNLAWFGLDELTYCPEEAWLRLEGRLRDPEATRLCGFAVWTPKGRDWVWRRFFEKGGNAYEVILAKPFENRFVLDRVPDFYERLKSSYGERFYAQEVLGEYLLVSEGLVYYAFDRAKHVRDCEPDPRKTLLWALDFNVTPMSSVIAQENGDSIRVIDEIVLQRATTQQACDEFLNRYGSHPGSVMIYGDASGKHMQTTGYSDYRIVEEALRGAGILCSLLRVPAANPPIRERTNLVNAMLCSANGEVSLWIDKRCKELIRDFEEVEYKPNSMVIDKERDPSRTHLSDALGYLLWQERHPRMYAGERAEAFM